MVGFDTIRRSLSRGRSHSDPEDHLTSSRSNTPSTRHSHHHNQHHHHQHSRSPFPFGHHRHHHHHHHRSRGRSRSSSVSSDQDSDDNSHLGYHHDDHHNNNMHHSSSQISVGSTSSAGSTASHHHHHHDGGATVSSSTGGDLPPPVLVYHESARSIVFRDHIRRVEHSNSNGSNSNSKDWSRHTSSMSSPAQSPTSSSHQQRRATTSVLPPIEKPPPMTTIETINDGVTGTDSGGDTLDGGDAFHEMKAQNHRMAASESNLYVHEDVSQSFSTELTEMAQLFGAPEAVNGSTRSVHSVEIAGFQPTIEPLPKLSLDSSDEFGPLLESTGERQDGWSPAEREVYQMLMDQRAVVKTIKNGDWTPFLYRFKTPHKPMSTKFPNIQDDKPAHDEYPFASFCTPCSLLPPGGKKMRAYGANSTYTTGVVFGLPSFSSDEEETKAASDSRTWSWPSGYAAKTEFNRSERGELINGRGEALVSLSKLREYNTDYVTKEDYVVAGRMLIGGLKTVPYNEVFVRVGGPGRIVNGEPVGRSNTNDDGTTTTTKGVERSFDKGVGLPVALFVRSAQYGHLISLLRAKARCQHVFGEKHVDGLPLLLITPEDGIRVLTKDLELELLKVASRQLNPFQNSLVSHKTKIGNTDPNAMQTKLEELLTLDDSIREVLTKEELARLAGGFGVTDSSIASVLRDAMLQDKQHHNGSNADSFDDLEEHHCLQDIVNEGLASAVRSGDYYTSRQLLILYSLVASEGYQMDQEQKDDKNNTEDKKQPALENNAMVLSNNNKSLALNGTRGNTLPPPPPLDTDRLRSATNSDGLLAVLGAAQILKAIQDGTAKRRTEESFLAVEEWIDAGEQNIAFRLASWTDQRAAQKDLEIAVNADSSFMAFVSGKAITNRRNFARQLREAVDRTDFSDMRFLTAIYEIVNRMHSPCLRLELLQYALGLDNRYSIAHVKRAIELAATCLSISLTTTQVST